MNVAQAEVLAKTPGAHAAFACERMMPKPLDYRSRLLAIVDAFLDPSAASQARAHRLVNRLYHDPRRRHHTINELVWGTFVSELTDSVFTDDAEYLHETREILAHGSPELRRAYLNYNFRAGFTDAERDWHAQLTDLAAWLRSKPFPWQTEGTLSYNDSTGPQAEYVRRAQAVRALALQSPPPAQFGEETLYHFILRNASAVLMAIAPRISTYWGYLVADAPYTAYNWNPADPHQGRRPIDATASVEWAARALRSITLEDWVWFTWQITPKSYHVSLH